MDNQEAMKKYDVNRYRTPDGYTSDIAVFTIISEKKPYAPPDMTLKLMLIKRSMTDSEDRPNIEAGKWALPGGFVQEDESSFEAASRELEEETGISDIHLKQYGVYDKPGRDPRGWIISSAHYAIVPEHRLKNRKANDDASEVNLFSLDEVEELTLAFDHQEIIRDAVERIKLDMMQTTVARKFLPDTFTYSELQTLLLTVSDEPSIKSKQAFSRKIKMLPFIEVVDEKTVRTSKQPAQLYRFTTDDVVKSIYTARY